MLERRGPPALRGLLHVRHRIRMDTGTHAPAVLSRPLAVSDKEALLKGPAVEHPSDVLTYRVPLRTVAPPDEERGGDGH